MAATAPTSPRADSIPGVRRRVAAVHFPRVTMLRTAALELALWISVYGMYLLVYRELRTVLLLSLVLASIAYVMLPTAPPRLVPGLGIVDTVGLSVRGEEGSFSGIRFNPYAAMPSMHVGWSLLVALFAFRMARARSVQILIAAHPVVMAIAVTATGNHFFLDSLVGAALALATLVVWRMKHIPRRTRLPCPQPCPG